MENIQLFDPTGSPITATVRLPIRTAYYTGYTSNANASARAAIATQIQVGNAVCYDPVTGTSGSAAAGSGNAIDDRYSRIDGWDVTRPQTSILNHFAGIVYRVLPVQRGTAGYGGLVQIIPAGSVIQCTVTSAGAIAVGDVFTVVDASFDLQPIPALGDVSSAAANQTAVLNIMRRAIAMALDVDAGAITSQLRGMRIGGSMVAPM